MNQFDNYHYDELFKYLHLKSIIKLVNNENIYNIMEHIEDHINKDIYGAGLI